MEEYKHLGAYAIIIKNDQILLIKKYGGPYDKKLDLPGGTIEFNERPIDTLKRELLEGVENRKAYFKEVLAYCEPGKEPITFIGITPGTIAKTKSGTYGWSWDFIFIPDGQDKTLGCYPDEERWKFWSLESYQKLAEYLNNK